MVSAPLAPSPESHINMKLVYFQGNICLLFITFICLMKIFSHCDPKHVFIGTETVKYLNKKYLIALGGITSFMDLKTIL